MAGLGFEFWGFLREGEVVAHSSSYMNLRAMVDTRGVMGSSVIACRQIHHSASTAASQLYTICS